MWSLNGDELWAIVEGGVVHRSTVANSYTTFDAPANDYPIQLSGDADGRPWILTRIGIWRLDDEQWTGVPVPADIGEFDQIALHGEDVWLADDSARIFHRLDDGCRRASPAPSGR